MNLWRKWHKWLGLILGIQVLLWISGGVVMSVIPIDMVRGQHLAVRHTPISQPLPAVQMSMQQWQKLEWKQRLDGPILLGVDLQDKEHWMQPDGTEVLPLNAQQIQQVAGHAYLGEGALRNTQLLEHLPQEADFLTGPIYRVDFDDWINTTFYLHPHSGQILSVRSDLWRLFDFFWMLHILDFEEREDFNNPLLIGLAIFAWLFTLSGFILLYHAWLKPNIRKWRYQISR
ncbi:PepSY domain-containing protein [Aliiglaciecola sp. CAU 1673]|uniref:PepSY domain-containing protein n=1 Tax=Aliiglaciecola sp. CAU 1673 TaxID=3032595 RepID=UPI0023DB8A93|nr:PepSY domain-containing protein [Aliiglaciecola sp. CAU 1673]MDF2179529.1 PepSY domain-containing protein [Aliiglaciecola sp. CAU 1673]